jgi:lysophospholipase L1-like esterase
MFSCALDGTGVAELRRSALHSCTLPLYPDAVVLFWHTDVSDDPSATGLGDPVVSAYTSDTAALLTTLTSNVPNVAISSQGVLNEGWGLFGPHPPHYKDAALDYYSSVNADLAKSVGIPYIDIRSAMKATTPATQLFYRRCNTQDGEHPNVRGTKVVAKLFADVIRTWLTSPQ